MFTNKIFTLFIAIIAIISLSTLSVKSQTVQDTVKGLSETGIGGSSKLVIKEKMNLGHYRVSLLKYDANVRNFEKFDINRNYIKSAIPKEKTLLIPLIKIYFR